MRSIASLTQQKKDFENGKQKWVEPLREWILDMKQADFLSSSGNFGEIAFFVKKVGTNPMVRGKSPHFGFSPPSENTARLRARLVKMHARQVRAGGYSERLSETEISICGQDRTRT